MSALRKRTKFVFCDRHRPWFETCGPRSRQIECLVEGGPGGWSPGCEGGRCRIWPGTDAFEASVCGGEELPLEWTTVGSSLERDLAEILFDRNEALRPHQRAVVEAVMEATESEWAETIGPLLDRVQARVEARLGLDLQITEQSTAGGEHGFVLWRGRVPFPVLYPDREQAEHAKSMIERGVEFEVVGSVDVLEGGAAS